MSACLFVCLSVLFKLYKLYYGGAQKRPDENYCKTVRLAEGNNIQNALADNLDCHLKIVYKRNKTILKQNNKIAKILSLTNIL